MLVLCLYMCGYIIFVLITLVCILINCILCKVLIMLSWAWRASGAVLCWLQLSEMHNVTFWFGVSARVRPCSMYGFRHKKKHGLRPCLLWSCRYCFAFCCWSSGIYAMISPGWHCSKLQSVSRFDHDMPSLCLNFCNVDSLNIFSFLILYVVYPLFFNAASMSNLYTSIC